MTGKSEQFGSRQKGFILPLVAVAIVMLAALAIGAVMASYGARVNSARVRNETQAMLAAEAGYEKAVFWMSQQTDILSGLQDDSSGAYGSIQFTDSSCSYSVQFEDFIGAHPVFRILSTGASGSSSRVVDTYVMQEITGWVMGSCRVPSGTSSTYPVNFADGEIIDMRLHINNLHDNPDGRDIYIIGEPDFLQKVSMGESRRRPGGWDKYADVIDLFSDGISFDQPDAHVTNESAVTTKVQRFRDSTDSLYTFTPVGTADVPRPHGAVQLEFFVENGVGKVRITRDCTVCTYKRSGSSSNSWDYRTVPGSGGDSFQKYDIYAYHYTPDDEPPVTAPVSDTYVSQSFGGKQSDPGGQIFVDGDVVIGGAGYDEMVVKGKITVVATGNIWVADSIVVAGEHDPATGMPAEDNPNVLGLIAQGVVKVIDPGMSSYSTGYRNYYPGPPDDTVQDSVIPLRTHSYEPVGNGSGHNRYLPDPTVIEAAVTVGGGGWGAENVRRGHYGGRKEASGSQDLLILRGTITEVVRGVVGVVGKDGYIKTYYFDTRLLEGILPGDIWFSGKFIPAPAGWHDYRPVN